MYKTPSTLISSPPNPNSNLEVGGACRGISPHPNPNSNAEVIGGACRTSPRTRTRTRTRLRGACIRHLFAPDPEPELELGAYGAPACGISSRQNPNPNSEVRGRLGHLLLFRPRKTRRIFLGKCIETIAAH